MRYFDAASRLSLTLLSSSHIHVRLIVASTPTAPTTLLIRASSSAGLIIRSLARASNLRIIRMADLVVARAHIQAVIGTASLLLGASLGLLGRGLVRVEGGVGVGGCVVRPGLGVLG